MAIVKIVRLGGKAKKGMPKRLDEIPKSGIDAMFLMAEKIQNLVRLEIGQPDFPTPEKIREAAKKAMDSNLIRYTPAVGMLSLRKEIAEKLKRDNGIEADPEKNVAVVAGALNGLFTTMMAVLDEGDEVILVEPAYPQYEQMVKILGCKPVHLSTSHENKFHVTAKEFQSCLTHKTRMIILNYPCNPTGATLSKEELKAIVETVENKNIHIMADEVYEKIIFGGRKHCSIASLATKNADKIVSVYSFSKTYSMTGWRLGYVAANEGIISKISTINDNDINCPSTVAQYAALEALKSCEQDVGVMAGEYEKRTGLVYDILNGRENIEIFKPEGAFYAFPRIKLPVSSLDFCMRLLKEKKVATIPGSAFGSCGENHVRISCANSMENIKIGAERLTELVEEISKKGK